MVAASFEPSRYCSQNRCLQLPSDLAFRWRIEEGRIIRAKGIRRLPAIGANLRVDSGREGDCWVETELDDVISWGLVPLSRHSHEGKMFMGS